jgi:hypothetical protein
MQSGLILMVVTNPLYIIRHACASDWMKSTESPDGHQYEKTS